jgi:hypothetical protein
MVENDSELGPTLRWGRAGNRSINEAREMILCFTFSDCTCKVPSFRDLEGAANVQRRCEGRVATATRTGAPADFTPTR